MSYEPDVVPGRPIAKVVAVAFVVTAVAIVVARFVLGSEVATPPATAHARVAPSADLDHFGWADRDAGIAKIPIERAMDLVAQDAGR